MKQSIIYFALCFLIIACGKDTKKTTPEDSSKVQETTTEDNSKIGRNNYAVIWKWTTSNEQLVSKNTVLIGEELNELWQEDIIENVYYNSNAEIGKLGYFPNISFFIKSHSTEKAKTILDKFSIVKKNIASYQLYPVGTLWMDRKADLISEKGMTLSFVSVWATKQKPSQDLVKKQSDAVLGLWNNGDIENVYFDIEGTQKANSATDFVFYINTNSEEEAKALCNAMPFYKENIASYELYPVGVFWMGKSKPE